MSPLLRQSGVLFSSSIKKTVWNTAISLTNSTKQLFSWLENYNFDIIDNLVEFSVQGCVYQVQVFGVCIQHQKTTHWQRCRKFFTIWSLNLYLSTTKVHCMFVYFVLFTKWNEEFSVAKIINPTWRISDIKTIILSLYYSEVMTDRAKFKKLADWSKLNISTNQ